LDRIDINILKCELDIHRRMLIYPTDVFNAWYLQTRAFYCNMKGCSKHMVERVAKYQQRGFKLLGYYDARNGMVQRKCDNTITKIESQVLHMHILEPHLNEFYSNESQADA
jgi:hypothetical protein